MPASPPYEAEGSATLVRESADVEAGFRYVTFIIMPCDEKTVRLLAEHMMPVAALA